MIIHSDSFVPWRKKYTSCHSPTLSFKIFKGKNNHISSMYCFYFGWIITREVGPHTLRITGGYRIRAYLSPHTDHYGRTTKSGSISLHTLSTTGGTRDHLSTLEVWNEENLKYSAMHCQKIEETDSAKKHCVVDKIRCMSLDIDQSSVA